MDDKRYMVTGMRQGYRVPIMYNLSHDKATDLKEKLNKDNKFVNASVILLSGVAVRTNKDINKIIHDWNESQEER